MTCYVTVQHMLGKLWKYWKKVPTTNMERLLVVFQIFRSWTLVPQQIPAETVSAEKCFSYVLLFSIHQVTLNIPKM